MLESTHSATVSELNSGTNLLAFVDSKNTQLSMQKLLSSYALGGPESCQVQTGGLTSAIEFLSNHDSPQILMVDVSDETDPLARMSALANVCRPETKVILFGSDNNIELYRALKSLGIHDYLTKPINQSQLTDVLGTALGKSSSNKRSAQQLVVTGCGGGVGVSTLVANISRGLAGKGAQTLAADLNSYGGDLDLLLGASHGFGLMNLLSGQQQVDKLFIERSCSKVDDRLYVLKSLAQQQTFNPDSYQRLSEQLGQHYNYVVWDLASQLFALPGMLDLWLTADTKVIVCQPTLSGLRQAKAMLSLVAERQHGQRVILVLNYIHSSKDLLLTEKQMVEQLGQEFDHVLPYVPKAVTKAGDLGDSLLTGSNLFSRALANLVADIWGDSTTVKPSLLNRLRKAF